MLALLMMIQRARMTESSCAESALEGLLACVGVDVLLEADGLGEALSAVLATIGLVAGVRLDMLRQIDLLHEGLAALLALEGLLAALLPSGPPLISHHHASVHLLVLPPTSMGVLMLDQMRLVLEGLTAQLAFEGLDHACVALLVLRAFVGRGEGLEAVSAQVGSVGQVHRVAGRRS